MTEYTKGPWVAFYPSEILNSDYITIECEENGALI